MNPASPNKTRRWMLVDDNDEILTLLAALAELLTDATIECHQNPQAALAAYSAAPGNYELVVTDFDMPGMNGVELCRRLRSISATQKVFLATGSGYFSEAAAQYYGFSALLSKPFPLTSFYEALESTGLAQRDRCAT